MEWIVDTHAHYDDEAFDGDRKELLSGLRSHGIGTVVNIGASMASCRTTLALAAEYPFIYAAVGVHPNETGELSEGDMDWLKAAAKEKKTVAIGEIGRDAAKDTLDIMKSEHHGETGGVIHCFSYGVEIAKEYLDMGYYLGIGGVLTFKNAKKLKEVAEYAPLSRLVLETDCPYLAPVPDRGKRNSSLELPYVVKALAEIRGITPEEVIRATAENARKLYRLPEERYGNEAGKPEADH